MPHTPLAVEKRKSEKTRPFADCLAANYPRG